MSVSEYILTILLLAIALSSDSQSVALCSNQNIQVSDYSLPSFDGGFETNKEAVKLVEELMSLLEMPMDFKLYSCSSKNCKKNAFAVMNSHGERLIIYDNDWFKSIEADTTNIKGITILAHEIGHHISAHSLSLNYFRYEDAYNYCNTNSPNYNKKICLDNYINDYQKFLSKSRKQELEADRFAGYLVCLYGLESDDALQTFSDISEIESNPWSTHPSLSDRKKAFSEGFALAEKDKKAENFTPNIQKIKNRTFNYDLELEDKIGRQKLLNAIKQAVGWNAIYYINKKSNLDLTMGYGHREKTMSQKFRDYHIDSTKSIFIDTEFEYFDHINRFVVNSDQTIKYNLTGAIYIKDSILKILVLENDVPRIVYTSLYNKAKVDLKQIEEIFIEIYDSGISKEIDLHNKKNVLNKQ